MVQPPVKIPLLLRPLVLIAERIAGKKLLPARILSRTPRIAFVSAITESGIEKAASSLGKRLAGLVRIQASYSLHCPFCIDMNVAAYKKAGISSEEVIALRNARPEAIQSFSPEELLLLRYVRLISASPLEISEEVIGSMERSYGTDAVITIAALAAKVNYWGRLIQALGIPPAGYLAACDIPQAMP